MYAGPPVVVPAPSTNVFPGFTYRSPVVPLPELFTDPPVSLVNVLDDDASTDSVRLSAMVIALLLSQRPLVVVLALTVKVPEFVTAPVMVLAPPLPGSESSVPVLVSVPAPTVRLAAPPPHVGVALSVSVPALVALPVNVSAAPATHPTPWMVRLWPALGAPVSVPV